MISNTVSKWRGTYIASNVVSKCRGGYIAPNVVNKWGEELI